MWSARLTRTRLAFLTLSGTADVCVLSSKQGPVERADGVRPLSNWGVLCPNARAATRPAPLLVYPPRSRPLAVTSSESAATPRSDHGVPIRSYRRHSSRLALAHVGVARAGACRPHRRRDAQGFRRDHRPLPFRTGRRSPDLRRPLRRRADLDEDRPLSRRPAQAAA